MNAPLETRFVARFVAEVRLDGINPYVAVPNEIRDRLGEAPSIPVLVRLARVECADREMPCPPKPRRVGDADRLRAIGRLTDGGEFRSTIVPRTQAPSRLFLDAWMREAAVVQVGDCVCVALEPDLGSRELAVPSVLRDALERDARAKIAWDNLAPSRRREILTYLHFLKTPAALEKNVRKIIASLNGMS